jgi:uncharacterized protein (DUF305 family)
VRLVLAALMAAAVAVSCRTGGSDRPPLVQPGAPGQATRPITVQQAVQAADAGSTAADVTFMQAMIGHHAQALEMTALLPPRTTRDDMRLMARRIELSQSDEIAFMQGWLKVRGHTVPDLHQHHHGATLMPGMLTPEEMTRLEEATGIEFDRLFLEFMIRHHDGALIMVNELLAIEGAGQESEIFAFVSDVDTDQRIEIDRMSVMLLELPK